MIIKYLERHGANPILKSFLGVTSLHLAALSGKVATVEYLIQEHKLDPLECTTQSKSNSLHYACKGDSE